MDIISQVNLKILKPLTSLNCPAIFILLVYGQRILILKNLKDVEKHDEKVAEILVSNPVILVASSRRFYYLFII